MALPNTSVGALYLSDIVREFGPPVGRENGPIFLSDYYRGAGLVMDTPANAAVPVSGQISFSNFFGAEAEWTTQTQTLVFTDTLTGYDTSWLTSGYRNTNVSWTTQKSTNVSRSTDRSTVIGQHQTSKSTDRSTNSSWSTSFDTNYTTNFITDNFTLINTNKSVSTNTYWDSSYTTQWTTGGADTNTQYYTFVSNVPEPYSRLTSRLTQTGAQTSKTTSVNTFKSTSTQWVGLTMYGSDGSHGTSKTTSKSTSKTTDINFNTSYTTSWGTDDSANTSWTTNWSRNTDKTTSSVRQTYLGDYNTTKPTQHLTQTQIQKPTNTIVTAPVAPDWSFV